MWQPLSVIVLTWIWIDSWRKVEMKHVSLRLTVLEMRGEELRETCSDTRTPFIIPAALVLMFSPAKLEESSISQHKLHERAWFSPYNWQPEWLKESLWLFYWICETLHPTIRMRMSVKVKLKKLSLFTHLHVVPTHEEIWNLCERVDKLKFLFADDDYICMYEHV